MQTNNTMTTDPAAIVHFLLFPRHILSLDKDLEARFLGSDLSEICAAAYESDIPILKAFAASPLKKREEAHAAWRAAQVKILLSDPIMSARVEAFLKNAPPEIIESFHRGKMSLSDADFEIKNRWQAAETDRMDSKRIAKDRLWNFVRSQLVDLQEEKHFGKTIPRHVILFENGKTEFFRYRTNAIRAAKKSGMLYLLMGIDGTRVKAGNLDIPRAVADFEEEEEAKEIDEIDDFTERTEGSGVDPADEDGDAA